MCILEFSRTLIYKFHYDYIKHKFDNRLKLFLFLTDTDGLMHEIKTKDV